MDRTRPPRTLDWNHELVDQLDWHWHAQLRPRLEGLTDDELHWEPVPGCWGIRPRAASSAPMQAGVGEAVMEYAFPQPDPPPVTTIAWRLGHVAIGVLAARVTAHFPADGEPAVGYETAEFSLTAVGALAQLDRWYARWIDGVRSLDAADLALACGDAEGPFAESSMATLVLHIHREAIHHLAEVCLLRDLYGAAGSDPLRSSQSRSEEVPS